MLAVVRIDGQAVGDGAPGGLTRQLAETYWAWHRLAQFGTPIAY